MKRKTIFIYFFIGKSCYISIQKASSDFSSKWHPVVDDVRTRIIQNKGYFYVPDLKMIA